MIKKSVIIKKVVVFFLLMASLSSLSCTKRLTEKNLVFGKVSKKMLIAGDSSEFKDRVREEIIRLYKNEFNFDVVNIEKLKKVDALKYDIILIMDTTMAWAGFNPTFKRFLEDSRHLSRTVLFMTAGDPGWEYSYKEIDAVTSASDIENIDAAVSKIRKEIEQKKTESS